MYEEFNNEYVNKPDQAAAALDQLIDVYNNSGNEIFIRFAGLLKRYHDPIVNSLICVRQEDTEKCITRLRRLSNGPIESFNNGPSVFRSNSHGVTNFEFVRNRILWSERDDAPIHAVPKSEKEVHTYTGRKRGPYTKRNH